MTFNIELYFHNNNSYNNCDIVKNITNTIE